MTPPEETPSRIEPCLLDEIGPELLDLVAKLSGEATGLGARLHPRSAAGLADAVRITNCHYSNLIATLTYFFAQTGVAPEMTLRISGQKAPGEDSGCMRKAAGGISFPATTRRRWRGTMVRAQRNSMIRRNDVSPDTKSIVSVCDLIARAEFRSRDMAI